MKVVGFLLWSAGLVLAVYAMLVFDPSIDSGSGYGRIVNYDLQQRQMMMLIAGSVMFAVGAILHGAAYFLPKTNRVDQTQAPDQINQKIAAPVTRVAYARSLGITESASAYHYANQEFGSIEDAIAAAKV